jgi:hypothetical protein
VRGAKPARDAQPETWSCGYAASSPRVQYTGTSLSHTAVSWFGRLMTRRGRSPAVTGVFPASIELGGDVEEPVLDRIALPAFRTAGRALPWIRRLQAGNLHMYILYILLALTALMVWR